MHRKNKTFGNWQKNKIYPLSKTTILTKNFTI